MGLIYGVDGEHGNDSNSGIVTVISEEPLVIDWSNAWKTVQKAFDEVLPCNIVFIRGNADNSDRLVYDEDFTTKRHTNLNILWSDDYSNYILCGEGILLRGIGDKPILKNNSGSHVINISHNGYVCENIEVNNLDTSNQYLFNSSFIQNWIFIDCILNAKNRGFYYYNHCNNWNFINCEHNSETNNGYGIFYGAVSRDWNWIIFKDCETNVENPIFDTVVDVINVNSFKNLQSVNLIRTGQKYIKTLGKNIDGSTSIRFTSEKSVLINISSFNPNIMVLKKSTIISPTINLKKGFIIKNSILWNEDEIIYTGDIDVTFENCIARNFPAGAELINCVTTDDIKFVDPASDDYSLQKSSPARKVNWTGSEPIFEDLGAIPYTQIPVLSTLNIIPTPDNDKIKLLSFIAEDEKETNDILIEFNDGGVWTPITMAPNDTEIIKTNTNGILNYKLWDTNTDINDRLLETNLRLKSFDGENYSEYLLSETITIDNRVFAPEIQDLNIAGNKDDILLTFNVRDNDNNILETKIEYYLNSTWNEGNIKYNPGKIIYADKSIFVTNSILWDSYSDITTDENIKIRIGVKDEIHDWVYVESELFDLNNQKIDVDIHDVVVTGNKRDIEIAFRVDDDEDISRAEIEYLVSGTTYETAHIKYNPTSKVVTDGTLNIFLWDSFFNQPNTQLIGTRIRLRVYDKSKENWSDWYYSNIFNIDNRVFLPEIQNLNIIGENKDIILSFEAKDEDDEVLNGTIEFNDNETWLPITSNCNPALMIYNDGTFTINNILWNSYEDITERVLETQIRIKVIDKFDNETSYLYSDVFTIDNEYRQGSLDSISFDSNSEDILIQYRVFTDGEMKVNTEIQYYDNREELEENKWKPITFKYSNVVYSIGSPVGSINQILWDSLADLPLYISTNIRIRFNDGEWINWVTSDNLNILNGSLPPKALLVYPIRSIIKEEERIEAKIKKI